MSAGAPETGSETGTWAVILKWAKGYAAPPHKHLAPAHTYIIKGKLQVRVGQGQVEYGKLVSQLARTHYSRALSVVMWEMPEVDHSAELRKMRLLLESLL